MNEPLMVETKPMHVQAMLFDGDNPDLFAVYEWVESLTQGSFDPFDVAKTGSGVSIDPETGKMMISTLRGVIKPDIGDWVVYIGNGQFTKMPHAVFKEAHRTLDGSDIPEPRPQPISDEQPEETADVPPEIPTQE